MPEREVTVTNEVGLHARPAALFSRKAASYPCDVILVKDGVKANGKSILSILKLDVRPGDTLTLSCTGERASESLDELVLFVESL